MTKATIRRLSRQRGLPTWDLPAKACLASRLPYGMPLTVEALARVEAAELALHQLWGCPNFAYAITIPWRGLKCLPTRSLTAPNQRHGPPQPTSCAPSGIVMSPWTWSDTAWGA